MLAFIKEDNSVPSWAVKVAKLISVSTMTGFMALEEYKQI